MKDEMVTSKRGYLPPCPLQCINRVRVLSPLH
ncbi:hypothetical protein I7I48_11180 [Histoplasma ohiense]|nr:hypothetical protein I7I48_11180 [Histoplasma ohiense (nom. inval.)]